MKRLHYFSVCLFVLCFTSCKNTQFNLTGEKAYELKQYSKAPALLQREFRYERDPAKKAAIAFEIGEAYRNYNQYAKAADAYRRAVDLGKTEAALQQGRMLMCLERYDSAIVVFKKLYPLGSLQKGIANREIKNCENAKDWLNFPLNYEIKNIAELNSPTNDFAPTFNNGKVYFTSSRASAAGETINAWTGELNADIFYADKNGKEFSSPKTLSETINTDAFEGTTAFNTAGNEFYFTRCATADFSTKEKLKTAKNEYCHIYYSRKIGSDWSEPGQLNLFADTVNVGQPALSKDGNTLYVSADTRRGFGGKDIYFFTKTDTGWSVPNNPGGNINSRGDDMFPWVDERGNLYYASNGFGGMGGLDIFRAHRTRQGFDKAANMRAPINSSADDFGFVIEKTIPRSLTDSIVTLGYFSSNRKGGKGGDDIYSFAEKWANLYVLKGLVETKNYENPENPDSKVLGLVPLEKVMVIVKSSTDSFTVVSDAAGLFSAPLKAETDYKLTYYKPTYFAAYGAVTTKGKRTTDSLTIVIPTYAELEKVFPQKEIVIPNIYYDYDKATLRPESKLVLDSILIFFGDNPELKIEIGSHTDARGSDEYNLDLSQRRAQSVVDYLIENGVAADRLTARGYGETKLVNHCGNGVDCTEEEHQQNRRTTFRIVGTKQTIESVSPDNERKDPKEKNQE